MKHKFLCDEFHQLIKQHTEQPLEGPKQTDECTQVLAYPGVRDNRSTLNTKTGYDDTVFLDPCLYVWIMSGP